MNAIMMNQSDYYLTEFDKLPSQPGIYSWHVFCRDINKASDYYEFFKGKRMNAAVTASLSEEYRGELRAWPNDDVVARTSHLNLDLFEMITRHFCPPIYIGITQDQTLRIRLDQHKTSILKLLKGGVVENNDSKFAVRIAQIMRSRSLDLDESNLFVRIIPVDKLKTSDILDLEYVINRTYHPIFGEK